MDRELTAERALAGKVKTLSEEQQKRILVLYAEYIELTEHLKVETAAEKANSSKWKDIVIGAGSTFDMWGYLQTEKTGVECKSAPNFIAESWKEVAASMIKSMALLTSEATGVVEDK